MTIPEHQRAGQWHDAEIDDFPSPGGKLLKLLTAEQARRLLAFPLAEHEGKVLVAVADPSNTMVTETLQTLIEPHELEVLIAPVDKITELIHEHYNGK